MCDCPKSNFSRGCGRGSGGGRGNHAKTAAAATAPDIGLCVRTSGGRKVNTKCLLWSAKDHCCSRVRSVPVTLPLVPTFSALLEQLSPLVDEQKFSEPFIDGDLMPLVEAGDGQEVNWLAVAAVDGSKATVWLEKDDESGEKRLRAQLPPGVRETLVRAILASPQQGVVRSVDMIVQTPFEYQSYSGEGNNLASPEWGAAHTPLLRIGAANYADGKSQPVVGANPRAVSNALCRWTGASPQPPLSVKNNSDLLWGVLQFADHEIDLSPDDSGEPLNIVAPPDDPTLAGGIIKMNRSRYIVDENGVRQQQNAISAFIDASNVYGSSAERALALRVLDGSGKLKTSYGGKHPPFNVGAVYDNANANPAVSAQDSFICGDIRANENPLLISFHYVFLARHNYHCERLLAQNPEWAGDDERLYQEARRWLIAEMQHVVVEEALPELLGSGAYALPAYTGYSESVNAGIANEFSTAIYRLGHTMVSDSLSVGGNDVSLADLFFNPSFVVKEGARAILEGAAQKKMQKIDTFVVDALRNMLFGKPNDPAGSLHDLASLNLNRGADHGLPKYNAARVAYGLAPKQSFAQVSSNVDIQQALAAVYSSVDEIDLWIGALAEDTVGGGAQVGELTATGLREQFLRLRDGDRFWYESFMSDEQIATIKATSMADIIRQTTGAQVPDNCFVVNDDDD